MDSGEESGGAVGTGDFIVASGQCVSSIAFEHGHFWQTIWDHPDNAELRRVRKEPNLLLAGDRLTVPRLRLKQVSGATEEHHRFRRRGVPAKLHLRFEKDGKPRAGEDFRVDVDGQTGEPGTLDEDGALDVPIAPNAKQAVVYLGRPPDTVEYRFELGHVDPATELSGVRHRLMNLGFLTEPEEGFGERTRNAIRALQEVAGLEATGELDDATRGKLVERHGS